MSKNLIVLGAVAAGAAALFYFFSNKNKTAAVPANIPNVSQSQPRAPTKKNWWDEVDWSQTITVGTALAAAISK